ncbi:YbaB/EbfC family nucleoid-associated protein [Streptomyces sp. NPDC048462]|uniref:YbaB/EbfC family nucleoid-associated protein n=1 Tax=Streptomyces sp. NPDC048462 TaxID=3365555 RepID=UPI0037157796
MSESMEAKLAQAMAELTAVQEAVVRAEGELGQASATTRSRDRAVEVTVGPQGELTALKFPDNKYLNMTGPQLAASVMEAVQEGRSRMARRVIEVFEPLTRAGGGSTGLRGVDIDWDRAFGSALDDPAGGRRRSTARLHDEIHEDTD